MKIHLFQFLCAALLVTGCAANSDRTTYSPQPGAQSPAIGNISIISATYGSGTQFADVTARVIYWLRSPDAEFFARPEWLKADPTPGWNKALVIVYTCQGRRHIYTTGEGGKVNLDKLANAGM